MFAIGWWRGKLRLPLEEVLVSYVCHTYYPDRIILLPEKATAKGCSPRCLRWDFFLWVAFLCLSCFLLAFTLGLRSEALESLSEVAVVLCSISAELEPARFDFLFDFDVYFAMMILSITDGPLVIISW